MKQARCSFQHILKPKFLLGITATPEMDGKDVYAICDGNVAYQIHFLEAISRGWLAPFHYYGVYDETDYSQIRWLGSHYDEEQLAAAQLRTSQAEQIYRAWERHKQTRTIGFCSSIRQANFLASYFVEAGVAAIALHSGTVGMSREEAVRRLAEGSVGVIFTVDLFNEGVDIPAVDTLLFVRPTESLTVFTQQNGRGLRLSERKSHCTVIDLIGNYRNADVKLQLLAEPTEGDGKRAAVAIPSAPAGCVLELETAVVNLLEELSRKRMPQRDRLQRAFLDLRNELGRIPTYSELHLHGREDSKGYAQTFGSYVSFLSWAGCLTAEEQAVYEASEAWLRVVEKTAMAKSYKMIVLYMLERGAERWTEPVTPQEVAPFFHRYMVEKEFRKRIDFSDTESRRLWAYD